MPQNAKKEESNEIDEILRKYKTQERMMQEYGPIMERMKEIRHKIAIMSGKGGVGKTSVTVNIAAALKSVGFDVGILDADVHGPNVPKMLKVSEKPILEFPWHLIPVKSSYNIKVMSVALIWPGESTPVMWRGPYKSRVIRQFLASVLWGKLDYLIVDLPPGTGDEPITIMRSIPNIDGTILITTPQDVSVMVAKKAANVAKELNVPILGVIENMSSFRCPECGTEISLFGKGGGALAAEELEIPFLAEIPFDVRIRVTSDDGIPFVLAYPHAEAAKAFTEVAEKIRQRLEKE